ncbi:MAG: hypothetical protein Q7V62_15365 [Actinomycetota bacterium]|nr:hypothetical protein [Actinomycetota bacterium]
MSAPASNSVRSKRLLDGAFELTAKRDAHLQTMVDGGLPTAFHEAAWALRPASVSADESIASARSVFWALSYRAYLAEHGAKVPQQTGSADTRFLNICVLTDMFRLERDAIGMLEWLNDECSAVSDIPPRDLPGLFAGHTRSHVFEQAWLFACAVASRFMLQEAGPEMVAEHNDSQAVQVVIQLLERAWTLSVAERASLQPRLVGGEPTPTRATRQQHALRMSDQQMVNAARAHASKQ